MLLSVPLVLPEHLQTRAVQHDMNRVIVSCDTRLSSRESTAATAERRVIRQEHPSRPARPGNTGQPPDPHANAGIKGGMRSVRGFKSHDAAQRFCRERGEIALFFALVAVTTRPSPSRCAASTLQEASALRS